MSDPIDYYERIVAVPAWELGEWAWLCARLEEWLSDADGATTRDYDSYRLPYHPRLDDVTWMLASMANRMRRLASGLVTDPLA